MSKQANVKEIQGFLKDSPKCSNCENFTSNKESIKQPYGSQFWIKESNLRCNIGQFKVGKSNWCKLHKPF